MRWKDFFYVPYVEKVAVLIMIVIILLLFLFNVILSKSHKSALDIPQNDSLIANFERLHDSLESINKKTPKRFAYNPKSRRLEAKAPIKRETSNPDKQTEKRKYTQKSSFKKQVKFTEPQSIDLNEKDTAQWKMVPGIGSAYSARIVKYGEMLGGYQSLNQLKEVYGITDELFSSIAPYIRDIDVDKNSCVKFKINQLEFKEILAHPYINYEQTKAIVNLRRRTGSIPSIEHLAMLDEFTTQDIQKLAPYIEF